MSSDGEFGATGSDDGSVVVWDLRDGHVVRTIATPHGQVWVVAVSAGGKTVASSSNGTTRVWDSSTGTVLWSSATDVDHLAFSPDGTQLIGARFGEPRVWAVADGKLVWPRGNHVRSQCRDRGAIIAPDSRAAIVRTAVGCHQETRGDVTDSSPTGYAINVIEVASGAVLRTIASVGLDSGAFAPSPNGDRVAILVGTRLLVFDVASGQQLANFALTTRSALSPQTGLWLSADGRHALTLDPEAMIGWDLSAAKEVWREPRDGTFPTTVLAVGDGWIFLERTTCTARQMSSGAVRWRRERCAGIAAGASASRMLIVRGPSAFDVADPRTGNSLLPSPRREGPDGTVSALVVAADGRVAGASWDHTNWIWDDAGSHQLGLPVEAWRAKIGFLADGQLAVVGETKAGIAVFTFGPDRTLRSSTSIPHKDRFGGGRVIVGDRLVVEEVREHEYRRTVVDLAGTTKPTQLPMWKAERRAPNLRNESLSDATFNRDLSRAYIMGNGGPALHLWNTRIGRLLAEVPPSNHAIPTGLVLSHDENHLLVTYGDGAVELRSAADLVLERTFASGPKLSTVGAISPDGTLVVAAALDGLFVWRLADGAPLATVDFTANHEAPSAVAFTPDGKTLWVGTTLGNLHRFAVR